MNMKVRKLIADIFTYLVLGLGSIIFLTPIAWLLSTSLKDNQQVFRMPPSLIPSPALWKNYWDVLTASGLPFGRFFFNSLVIVCSATIGAVISSSIVSYSFARIRWKGRDSLFFIVIMTMVIPAEVIIVPQFVIYNTIGWVDTYLAIIVPAWATTTGLYLMKQFMDSNVSDAVLESARLDGSSEFNTFFRIAMPMVKPAWLTLIIYSFQGLWQTGSSTFIYSEELKTVNYAIGQILSAGAVRNGASAASSFIMMVVPIVVFLLSQSQIIETMGSSGMKD